MIARRGVLRYESATMSDYEPPAMDIEMHPVQVAGFRKMTAAQKVEVMTMMRELLIAMRRAGLRMRHPDWDEEKLEYEARAWAIYASTD